MCQNEKLCIKHVCLIVFPPDCRCPKKILSSPAGDKKFTLYLNEFLPLHETAMRNGRQVNETKVSNKVKGKLESTSVAIETDDYVETTNVVTTIQNVLVLAS